MADKRKKHMEYIKNNNISNGLDENYGLAQPLDDLLSTDKLEKKKMEFIQTITLSITAREQIELETRNQSNNQKWFNKRRNRLTASNFGKVCKMRPTSPCKGKVYDILFGNLTIRAMEYGKITEVIAKEKFETLTNLKFMDCGLFIDADKPYLAASSSKYDVLRNECFTITN